MVSPILSLNSMKIILTITSMDIRYTSVDQRLVMHLNLKHIATIVRSMDIEHNIVDPMQNLIGHLRGKEIHLSKVKKPIGNIPHGIIIIYLVNMVTLKQII
jgi:hypothetical protein